MFRVEGLQPRKLPSIAELRAKNSRKRPRPNEFQDESNEECLRDTVENAAKVIEEMSKEIEKLRTQYEEKDAEIKAMADKIQALQETVASLQSTVEAMKPAQTNNTPETTKTWAQVAQAAGHPEDWKMVTSRRAKRPTKPVETEFPCVRAKEADRRIIIKRSSSGKQCAASELVVAMNAALSKAQAPAHVRVERVDINDRGTVTAKMGPNATGVMALKFKHALLNAAKSVDDSIEEMTPNETWTRLKLHGVRLSRYYTPEEHNEGGGGLDRLREDLKNAFPHLDMPLEPRWLLRPDKLRSRASMVSHSSVVITLRSEKDAEEMRRTGLWLYGRHHTVEKYIPSGPDAFCDICCGWGHSAYRCERGATPSCLLCGEDHLTKAHRCLEEGCQQKIGTACRHLKRKCCNCGGAHTAKSNECPKKREALKSARIRILQRRKEGPSEVKKQLLQEQNNTQPTPTPIDDAMDTAMNTNSI